MTPAWRRRVRRGYAALEEAAGMLCPLLYVVSVIPPLATLQGIALLSLWIGCGHTLLHFYDLCPPLVRYRPFIRGLFAFAAGLCWPLWFLRPTSLGR